MPELVEEDDAEEREVLEDVPDGRGVVTSAGLDLEDGDEEPGPVEVNGDSDNTEDLERTLAAEHAGRLAESERGSRGKEAWKGTCGTFTAKDANLVFTQEGRAVAGLKPVKRIMIPGQM